MATVNPFDSPVSATSTTGSAVLRWSGIALVSTVWISATLFGLYILAFYASATADGELSRWNDSLPGLYEAGTPVATLGMGVHFFAGGVILALGCIQLIGAVRARYPALHRWIGRVYVTASIGAGIGGLAFIFSKGTVGGTVMDIGFSIYGALMIIAAVQAFRYARARQLELHRAWALRLFALAIGSWLYRMDYGFWLMLADGAGHAKDFHGPFDRVMAFFFYVPNLLVVEILLRARRVNATPALRLATSGVLAAATGFLVVGTYYFTKLYWGPAIVKQLAVLI